REPVREIKVQAVTQDALWRRHIYQTVVVRFRRRLFRSFGCGNLRLRWTWRRGAGLLELRPGPVRSIDSEALAANFNDGDSRSLFIKSYFDVLRRRFLDHQLTDHVIVPIAADHRATELASPDPVGSERDDRGFPRLDFLIDAERFKLDAVIDVRRSD